MDPNGSTTTTYYREIRIADWNENSAYQNEFFEDVIIHEIGHNWDSDLELTNVSSSMTGLWNSFLFTELMATVQSRGGLHELLGWTMVVYKFGKFQHRLRQDESLRGFRDELGILL